MNTLINTPLLRTSAIRTEFDNKIIFIFLGLIGVLMFLGLIFIDLIKPNSGALPIEEEEPDTGSITIFT